MVSLAARIYWNAAIQAKLVQQRTGRRLLQNSLRSIAATFVSTSDASMFVEQVDVLYSTVLIPQKCAFGASLYEWLQTRQTRREHTSVCV